jgi:hypothetical protein
MSLILKREHKRQNSSDVAFYYSNAEVCWGCNVISKGRYVEVGIRLLLMLCLKNCTA